jgi:hypothetical protein
MGKRLERATELAEALVAAGGGAMALGGLVPMLWEDNGWSGAMRRTGTLIPAAVGCVLGTHARRAWKERRARRSAAEE